MACKPIGRAWAGDHTQIHAPARNKPFRAGASHSAKPKMSLSVLASMRHPDKEIESEGSVRPHTYYPDQPSSRGHGPQEPGFGLSIRQNSGEPSAGASGALYPLRNAQFYTWLGFFNCNEMEWLPSPPEHPRGRKMDGKEARRHGCPQTGDTDDDDGNISARSSDDFVVSERRAQKKAHPLWIVLSAGVSGRGERHGNETTTHRRNSDQPTDPRARVLLLD
ncbi:hypothetical protein B0H11DRAFT_1943878 [Mycena galericulata]|nr:hypothetical protein B0H11DRAFT_1943878 [Mycena galericulata]